MAETEAAGLTSISGRLRHAINRQPRQGRRRGNRLFVHVMERRAESRGTTVRGATMPSILTYLSGEATPSVEFLEEAARVLGVRAAWLGFGDGEMTEAEQMLAALRGGEHELGERLVRAAEEGLGMPIPGGTLARRTIELTLLEILGRLAGMWVRPHQGGETTLSAVEMEDSRTILEDFARKIGAAIRAPLNVLGYSVNDPVTSQHVETYVHAMATVAIRALYRPADISGWQG